MSLELLAAVGIRSVAQTLIHPPGHGHQSPARSNLNQALLKIGIFIWKCRNCICPSDNWWKYFGPLYFFIFHSFYSLKYDIKDKLRLYHYLLVSTCQITYIHILQNSLTECSLKSWCWRFKVDVFLLTESMTTFWVHSKLLLSTECSLKSWCWRFKVDVFLLTESMTTFWVHSKLLFSTGLGVKADNRLKSVTILKNNK